MKKMKIAVEKFLILIICAGSLLACKNEEKDSGGWFSSADNLEHTTATEIEEGLKAFQAGYLVHPEEVQNFYASRGFAPVWNDDDLRDTFITQLQNAGEEGLSPSDYHWESLQGIFESADGNTKEDRVNMELLLSDAFLKYAKHLFYGKVDPRDLYSLWGVRRESPDFVQLLQDAVENKKVEATLDSLKPQHQVYAGLKTSLKEFRESKETDTAQVQIASGAPIKPGDRDSRIPQVTERLRQLDLLEEGIVVQDSTYSRELESSIKNFQKAQGLEPDGIIGNSTLEFLNKNDTQRFEQVLVNLERWRWYPRDLGDHYILVNIADFKLAVVKDGDTVRTHNVIAGSKARQTPVFTDTLEYIVINPQWNIPPTIQREDVIPKASRNPGYLASNNMTVSSASGERLDPADIDWSSPEVQSYRFTQSAGPSNPLGRVKIIYPNQYLIYLHDTPSKSLFDRADRAESSGCVRVENAVDLSAYVVDNQSEWSLEEIQNTIASGQTKQVKITRPIQVHHFYWTAWRGRDKTYFADDVYNLDQEVYDALTASN